MFLIYAESVKGELFDLDGDWSNIDDAIAKAKEYMAEAIVKYENIVAYVVGGWIWADWAPDAHYERRFVRVTPNGVEPLNEPARVFDPGSGVEDLPVIEAEEGLNMTVWGQEWT